MQDVSILIDEKEIPVTFNVNKRAKRIIAKSDLITGGIKITLPHPRLQNEALKFLNTQKSWIKRQLRKTEKNEPLNTKNEIFFTGKKYKLKRVQNQRFGVQKTEEEILISGNPEHHERRLNDFLKKEFEKHLKQHCKHYCNLINRTCNRITVKNINTRWGSCSSTGNLSFAFKLAFAPDWVIEYVIAHEVAHLVEMNHSEAFWKVVEKIYGDHTQARAWLKAHGHTLG